MNWRKHKVLLIGGGIAVLVILVVLVFLLRAQAAYRRVQSELSEAQNRFDRLTRREPYPSADNIERMNNNLERLRKLADEIQAMLTAGQIAAEQIEPADFAPLLERTIARLTQKAAESGVDLPERLTLGLARYLAGEMPAPEDVPRLVVQLKTMEAMCNLLFNARITSLISVDRQAFEAAARTESSESPTPVRRRRAIVTEEAQAQQPGKIPLPPDNPLYQVERVTVSFRARDAVLWEVFNALAQSPIIAVVVDAQLSNTLGDKIGKPQPVSPIGGDTPAPGGIVRYPTHEERVIAGREPIQANLIIDVYRFVKELKEDTP